MHANHVRFQVRRGFTLVELLVALAIMLALAGLAVLIIPAINQNQGATYAGTQLQQWIEIAKQRAARDRAPRGIRLLPGTLNATLVSDLQFIEQPPDFHLGNLRLADATALDPAATKLLLSRARYSSAVAGPGGVTYYRVIFDWFDPKTQAANNTPAVLNNGGLQLFSGRSGDAPVQAGDYLELAGQLYLIARVPAGNIFVPPTGPNRVNYAGKVLDLYTQPQSLLPALTGATLQYRIIRQPRPIGDDPLQMPQNIVVDVKARYIGSTSPVLGPYDLPPISTAAPIDIMFAPDGRVIGPLAAYDKIILWVRDTTFPDGQGDPTLVCIYPRTGLIAAHPVDATNLTTSPYTFTTTGRRSSN